MTTLMQLVAGIAVGVMICFAIIVFMFLVMSDKVPRVSEPGIQEEGPNSKLRLVLAVVLIAALIGTVIHFLMQTKS
jgi:hypothetical protein